jgi:hypothetical protein
MPTVIAAKLEMKHHTWRIWQQKKPYEGGYHNKYFMSAKCILKTAEPSSSHIIVEQSYSMFVPQRCSWRISCCETE